MKKVLMILLSVLAFCGTGCKKQRPPEDWVDPVGFGRFVWKNACSHPITISIPRHPDFQSRVIPVGAEVSVMETGLAYTPSLSDYVTWGVYVIFDDGPYGGEFDHPNGWRLDPQPSLRDESRYSYEEHETYYIPEWDEYVGPTGIWTYTFTDEVDYAAAVARGPLPQFEVQETE